MTFIRSLYAHEICINIKFRIQLLKLESDYFKMQLRTLRFPLETTNLPDDREAAPARKLEW